MKKTTFNDKFLKIQSSVILNRPIRMEFPCMTKEKYPGTPITLTIRNYLLSFHPLRRTAWTL